MIRLEEKYIIFKMKIDRAEALLHSLNYHKNLLESYGRSLTGAYPKFVNELHDLIVREKNKKTVARRG